MPSPPTPERSDAEAIRAFIANTQAHADQAYAALRERFPTFNDDPDAGVTGRALAALEESTAGLEHIAAVPCVVPGETYPGSGINVCEVPNVMCFSCVARTALRRVRALVEGNDG